MEPSLLDDLNPLGVVFVSHKFLGKQTVSAGAGLSFDPPPTSASYGLGYFISASQCLSLAFCRVADVAEALLVRLIIDPAFCKRNDVIALRRCAYHSLPRTLSAKRLTRKQLGAHRLQTSAGDPLYWCYLDPGLAWMLSTATTSIVYQNIATLEAARPGRRLRHTCRSRLIRPSACDRGGRYRRRLLHLLTVKHHHHCE